VIQPIDSPTSASYKCNIDASRPCLTFFVVCAIFTPIKLDRKQCYLLGRGNDVTARLSDPHFE
jgi:hypothetical protein